MLLVVTFLLTIGILVVVHEYGHYLFARLLNVKVLTFSIGFGPKLFSFQGKHNEWRISLIPLGGYVRMLDEREAPVADHEKHLAFNNKLPYQKILIASAGPLFNLLFAVLVYYFIGLTGVTNIKPVISSIDQNQAENIIKTQISAPSEILAINGYRPDSWENADKKFSQEVRHARQVNLQLKSIPQGTIENITVATDLLNQHFNSKVYLETLGLYPVAYLPTISYIEPNSVAAISGLKINDKILEINSKKISSWFAVAEIIHDSPGVELNLKIERQNKIIDFVITPKSKAEADGQLIGQIGIMPSLDEELLKKNTLIKKYNWANSASFAVMECYNVIRFNLVSIYQIITGNLSIYNLGGPITIAKVGANAIHEGILEFAGFLALISIGLAIMNLLPIPVLDGGHILIYFIELIVGKQLTSATYEFIFKLGFVVVLGLSLFAIYNDMMRL